MSEHKYLVSGTPHIRSHETVDNIMMHVIIALVPASLAAVYFFGINALIIIGLCVISSIVAEAIYQKCAKKPVTISDCSAALTGLLLALNLPPAVPLWIPVVGSFFAIIVVKQLFGGLGQNFMNPALGARAFLLASYPTLMTTWSQPAGNPLATTLDTVTSSTPLGLEMLKSNAFVPNTNDYFNALIGNISGCLGETCAIALIIGGLYLIVRKIITWHIPVIYILTVFGLTFIFGRGQFFNAYPLYEILVGGLMLGAFFMATDYSTSPISTKGKVIMGLGCGILTTLIRVYGGYPEGVSYSILLMNLAVPIIDKFAKPRVFGTKKEVKSNG